MNAKSSREFVKSYNKLPIEIQNKFKERVSIFYSDRSNPYLKVHGLRGKWEGCYSFNVTAHYRAIFEYMDENTIWLLDIGTHSQLYD